MKYTEKTAALMMNKLLRSSRKMYRQGLYDAFTDSRGRTCALDGYRAYCLNTAPAGVLEPCLNSSRSDWQAAENSKILDTVFRPLDTGNVVEMPAPDADAVKAHIAVKKANPYDLGAGYPMVDAQYLYDIIRLFPNARWYVDPDPYARMVRPIFIVADEGRACLLPIRSNSKPWKAPAAKVA